MNTVSRKALHNKIFTLMDTQIPQDPQVGAEWSGYHAGKRDAYLNVIAELRDFPSTESEGEAERLKDALKYVHGELIGGNIFSQNGLARALAKIESALEGSTLETAVQEITCAACLGEPFHNSHSYRAGCSDEGLFPGIKDGRDTE